MNTVNITISGTVQGVGFRPFVARTAIALGVKGFVRNTDNGVFIQVNADRQLIDKFICSIRTKSPKLAIIDRIEAIQSDKSCTHSQFSIEQSVSENHPATDIAPDTAVCEKCLHEFNSLSDKRHKHPFVNCTECGPRYSIINALPYDRGKTSMNHFLMCDYCKAEFSEMDNRRYHTQPVCCPDCGPSLRLITPDGNSIENDNELIIRKATTLLADTRIIAIKGIGGFHLACRADSKDAIRRLRAFKSRSKQPFACMVKNLEIASLYANLTDKENELLSGPQAPIVLVKKNSRICNTADFIAPGLAEIGLILPYTPLHHLLFENTSYNMLIMTSANNSGEPMYIDESEIISTQCGLVDAILTHDRPITVRLDDSVVKSMKTGTTLIRRGRGFTPSYIETPFNLEGIVALGGQLKNSLAFGIDKRCFVSEYLGTIDSPSVADECWKTFERLSKLLNRSVSVIASDKHPFGLIEDFSEWNIPYVKVQHHFAHAAACMAENGLINKTICVIYDGNGLGDDNAIWGGEILIADYNGYERVAHLDYTVLPGNDASVVYPGRCAIAYFKDISHNHVEPLLPWMPEHEFRAVLELTDKESLCTKSSSMGRLFDACAALLDICRVRTYEGQCAIELENCADANCIDSYTYSRQTTVQGVITISGASILKSVLTDRNNGIPAAIIAARFHNTISSMTVDIISDISEKTGIKNVVLSGGCFCNRLLTEKIYFGLQHLKLTPHVHKRLPPGDENISLGQVVIAAAQRETEQFLNCKG